MLSNPAPTVLLITLLPLTACKTWYKPGANEADLSMDQQRCTQEAQASTGQHFAACMERAGWGYTDSSVTDSTSEAGGPSVVEDETKPPNVQRHEDSADRTTHTAIASPATTRSKELSSGTKTPDQPRRPGGWMQFGADAGQLETAKAECNEANAGSETFKACMQAKGWHHIRLTVEPPGDSDH